MYKDISKDSGLLRKKKQHVLGLFIVEPEVKFATSLYDFFYKEKFAKIINTNFTNLIDESYDCLIVVGNVFGLPTASKGYTDLKESVIFHFYQTNTAFFEGYLVAKFWIRYNIISKKTILEKCHFTPLL